MSGNVPSIRFSGFTDPWEQRKLGDIAHRITRKNEGESDLPLTISAQYGLVDQRSFFNNQVASKDMSGYYLLRNGEFAYNKSTSGDSPWGAVKRLEKYEKGCVSTLYICFELDDADSNFIVTYYETDRWYKAVQMIAAEGARNHGLLNISPDDFFDTALTLPSSREEQERIGALFARLDDLITLHQRECDRLEKVRASLMQSMFPQPGETLPSIRFAEFTKPWHSKQLGSLVTPFDHRIPTPTDGYVRLGVRSFAKGTFLQDVPAEQAIGETELREVGPNNLIVNIVFAWEQAIAITSEADTIALVSHRFPQFSFNDGQCPDFYRYALLDPRFRHHLWLASPSGAGRNKTLRVDEMLEYWILVPSFEEQRAIADFFAAFDRSLDARRRLCEALGHVKNALLSSMFV